MAVTFVQNVGNAASTAAAETAAVAAATTAGNLLVLWGRNNGAALNSVTDTKSNTWTVVTKPAGSNTLVNIAYTIQAAGLTTSDTVTATWAASSGNCEAAIAEFSGIAATGTLLSAATADASGSGETSQSVTTAAAETAGSLAFAAFAAGLTTTWTVTASDPVSGGTWADLAYPGGTYAEDACYQVLGSATAAQATASTAATTTIEGLVVVFAAAGPPPGADSGAGRLQYRPGKSRLRHHHGARRQKIQAAFGIPQDAQPTVLPVILTAPTTATQDGAHW